MYFVVVGNKDSLLDAVKGGNSIPMSSLEGTYLNAMENTYFSPFPTTFISNFDKIFLESISWLMEFILFS